jgi:hypothetical protein
MFIEIKANAENEVTKQQANLPPILKIMTKQSTREKGKCFYHFLDDL